MHKSVKDWVSIAKNHFSIHLLSNNPSKRRIEAVAEQLAIGFSYGAAKPSRRALIKVIKEFQLPSNQIAIIGDRIFTDVLAGNRLGLYTTLVRPIGSTGIAQKSYNVQKLEQSMSKLLGVF